MASKFAGDIIAGGFAKGIGQGTAIRQSFAQKLGSQQAQRQRDLSYQNFQQFMQKQRQRFMTAQQQERLKIRSDEFMQNYQLRVKEGQRADAERVEGVRRFNARFGLQQEQFKQQQFTSALGVIRDESQLLMNELRSTDTLTQPNRIKFLQQQLDQRIKDAENLVMKHGTDYGQGPAVETIKTRRASFEVGRKAKVEFVRRKAGLPGRVRRSNLPFLPEEFYVEDGKQRDPTFGYLRKIAEDPLKPPYQYFEEFARKKFGEIFSKTTQERQMSKSYE